MSSLRRTAITRKTELKRTSALATRKTISRSSAAKRTVTKQRKQNDTGPTAATKEMLWTRAKGRCELCGRDLTTGHPFSRHHRRARGSGGSSLAWVNEVSNLLLLCGSATTPGGCHSLVETQKVLAYANGWVVRMTGTHKPAEVPVVLAAFDEPMYLTDAGEYAIGAP